MENSKASWQEKGLFDLARLRARLKEERETELLTKLSICQEPIELVCVDCGTRKISLRKCKRKWCPYCQRALAARRSAELRYIVERFKWPLFVTLTMRNSCSIGVAEIRKLRRSFTKLRNRKVWKDNVLGGIATVEITNIGNGWHPHMHCVCDCRWLAIKTPEIRKGDTHDEAAAKCKSASAEFERIWAKIIGQETASVKIKRADKRTIAKEVVKYSVKGSDLAECEESIGPLIRALESTRLLTTFGTAHGQTVREIRAGAKAAALANRSARNKTGDKPEQINDEKRVPSPAETPRDEMEDESINEWLEREDMPGVFDKNTPLVEKETSWESSCSCERGGAWVPLEIFDIRNRPDKSR